MQNTKEVIPIKFDDVYKEQAKLVFSYLYTLCGNYHTAEDLTQETFLKAYTHRKDFDESKKLSTWLCEIAKNLYIDYCRVKKNQEIPNDDLPINHTSENDESEIAHNELLKLIHQLDDPYKEVFLLKHSMGYSYTEISDIFGQTEGWVRLIYYRARIRLREMIEPKKAVKKSFDKIKNDEGKEAQ